MQSGTIFLSISYCSQRRREAFVQHEMIAELAWRSKLTNVASEEEKLRILQQRDKLRMERANLMVSYSSPISLDSFQTLHPGSLAQFKKVWKDEDGLDEDAFDPRTFFLLHDTTNDIVLDAKVSCFVALL
jgi:hypothetical protein